MSIHHLSIGSN
jgi:probable F420-dependent oxidoreductase